MRKRWGKHQLTNKISPQRLKMRIKNFNSWNIRTSYIRAYDGIENEWRRTKTLDEKKYCYFQQVQWDLKYDFKI
jgi:hypothetical protein